MNESEQEEKKKDAFSSTPSLVPDFTQTQGKALFEEPSPEPLQLGKVSSTILLLD